MAEPAGGVVVVMGIPVEGLENQRLVKRVMVVSVIFAVVICCTSVLQMTKETGNTLSRFMGLCLGLLVPACGYLGAKRGDRNLLGCFWGCNLFSGVCNVMACTMWIVMVTLFSDEIDTAYERCQADPKYVETGAVASVSGGGQCTQIKKAHATIHDETWIIALTIVFAFINIIMNVRPLPLAPPCQPIAVSVLYIMTLTAAGASAGAPPPPPPRATTAAAAC
jgi:hypothetical protein